MGRRCLNIRGSFWDFPQAGTWCGINSLWNYLHTSGDGDETPRGSAAPNHKGRLKSDKKHDFKMVEDFFSLCVLPPA